MEREDARTLVASLLRHLLGDIDLRTIDEDELLQDVVELDSVDFLELMASIHAATGVDVPERDYPRLATLGGVVDYVARAAP
jgi:acyl carrier protein